MSLAEKLFGSFSDRELKKINPLTKQVLALEGKYQAMSDAELQAQTPALKQKLADGKTLDDILPSLRCLPRGRMACAGHEAFPGAGHRRHRPAPGRHRRDADR